MTALLAARYRTFTQHHGPFLDNFVLLAKIYAVARQRSVSRAELKQLRLNCQKWVRTFEALYYRNDKARLKVCLVNNHSLLHLADHIRDFGPAIYWWAFPMERYIGNLKARLTNMASIDANLAGAALRMELLNHIPRDPKPPLPPLPILGPRVPLHYISDKDRSGRNFVDMPRGVKQQLEARFRTWLPNYPMVLGIVETDTPNGPPKGMERVALHTTLEVKRSFKIGSEYSQGDFPLYRRDNSYISWKSLRGGRATTAYGQVLIYCKCYDWDDIIVVVRRFKKLFKNDCNQLFVERDSLGSLESIAHTEIVGIIGRIGMNENGKEVLYLVLDRAEQTLENESEVEDEGEI